MENKLLTEKESLDLISKMIQQTHNRMEKSQGLPMLIWGYLTLSVTLAVGTAIHVTGSDYWHFLWFAIPVLGSLLMKLLVKRNPSDFRTFIDRVTSCIWWVMGGICCCMTCVAFFAHVAILNNILLIVGAGTAITGLVIRFTASFVGGVVAVALSLAMYFLPDSLEVTFIVFSIAFVFMLIIPGHVLNYKGRKLCVAN